MQNHKLTKLALSVLVASQLSNAEASVGSKVKEIFLTSKSEILEDPYYQIMKPTIRELTEEEALEFSNDEAAVESDLTTTEDLNKTSAFDLSDFNFGFGNVKAAKPIRRGTRSTLGKIRATVDPTSNANNVIMAMDKLVAIGQKIIPIIKSGEAIVTNSPMAAISVVPVALSKETVDGSMENWSLPRTNHFEINYPNALGMIVAKFVYSVTYQHGGTYQGKGQFLTGIRSAAQRINVVYGYNLDAKSKLVQISNIGQNGNVVAGAMIEMEDTDKNFSRQITTVDSFTLTGDGRIIDQK